MPWFRSKRPRSLAGLIAVGAEVFVVTLGSVVAISTNAWRQKSVALLGRLLGARQRSGPLLFEFRELEGLPEPVARYFRTVLREGQRIARSAEISQRGHFLLRAQPPAWRKFYATQHVATSPAGFVWDASIRVAPGISVLVRDALIDGAGSMRASVMGLWPLVSAEGTEIAAGALQRYLAEAPWVPTALLPSQGVTWTPLDDASARATITSGETTVSVDFFFATDGTVRRIHTDARSREVDGDMVPTPWQGHFSNYAEMHGMKIPLHGEVEWLLEDGPQEYWRGDITSVSYAYEEAG
jgi:hypothetical protein